MTAETALPLFSVAQLREIEHAAQAMLPPHTLMANAGRAAAAWLSERLDAVPDSRPVLVLAGPGNNGGDALVMATELIRRRIPVQVWLLSTVTTADARWAYAEARAAGVPIAPIPSPLPPRADFCWGVDGLFGIGLSRPIEGRAADVIAWFNAQSLPRLALDVPSGLDADRGQTPGAGGPVAEAGTTLSFLGATPGLFTGSGRDAAGDVHVFDLGAASHMRCVEPRATLNHPAHFAAHLPQRRHSSHKGTYGALGVIGGHSGMLGAPVLSSRAALYAGAGRVYTGFLAPHFPPYDSIQPELMMRLAEDLDPRALQAIAAGPGLGAGDDARMCLEKLLAAQPESLVLDADALNLLAVQPAWINLLNLRASPAIITPHPLEAARLLGRRSDAVQADRLDAARTLALKYGAVAVLKGSGTIIDDGHRTLINPTGNAGLATAGTGDILTGIIGALLAQGMPPFEAAAAGVWAHGRAAEMLAQSGIGPAGITASELLAPVRRTLNQLQKPTL